MSNADSAVGKTQQVMFGDVLELSPSQRGILDSVFPQIKTLGYELEISDARDEGIFRCGITGIPAMLGDASPAEALLKLIEDAGQQGEVTPDEMLGRMALSLAQSAALRANRMLRPEEAERLLADLFALPDPTYTPDGHRIISRISSGDLARRLG